MPRGRPTASAIRQNIVNVLAVLKRATGYDVTKKYWSVYPKCTQRVIYYHLQKGIDTGEFAIDAVSNETGEYSWGTTVQKVYYVLGPKAKPEAIVPQVVPSAQAEQKTSFQSN
jgi:hypothetical protein